MPTRDPAATAPKSAPPWPSAPAPAPARQRIPLREAVLLTRDHLHLLDWWPFVLLLLAYLGSGLLVGMQAQTGSAQALNMATELSRFVLEPGAGLFAGVLFSSLVVNDPLLEVTMATPAGVRGVVIWRVLLTFAILLAGSAAYLAWSLGNGITYAKQQNALYLLLLGLAPVLVMGMLGLFGTLLTRNAALGMTVAGIPLAGSLFLSSVLLPIAATHPFLITYTYSGGQDAPDWWANRLTLLGVALALAVVNWWLLHREEYLLGSFH